MTRIPQELLDLVIDYVAEQTRDTLRTTTLKALSLSSKSLRRRSRGHLFSHVALKYNTHHLSPSSEYRRLLAFKALLDGDRDLVQSIKSLEIWVDEFGLLDVHESPLSDIITVLYSTPSTALHTLKLRSSQYRPVPWDIIPNHLQDALYSICQSGSLQTLEFQCFRNIPLQLLWTAHPALQSLSIVDTTFRQLDGHPKFPIGTYSSRMGSHLALASVSVDRSLSDLLTVVEESPVPFGDLLKSLTKFHIIIDNADKRALPVEFLTGLKHLNSLSIFSDCYLGPESMEVEIDAFPTLSSINLQFEVATVNYAAQALNQAFGIITHENASNSVEEITINIALSLNILDAWDTTVVKSGAQKIEWDQLDATFSHERYPKLRSCEIVFEWAGLGRDTSRETRRTDFILCELLESYISPPAIIHPAVRVEIDLQPR